MILELLAAYVHNWSPVLLRFSDAVALRWYGLAYVGGFVAAFYLLKYLSRKKLWVVPESQVSDVVTWVAFFGVFVGGRLGYVLFYMIPEQGWGVLAEDPLVIFKVWEGGMASHGGILGIIIVTYIFARVNKLSWTGVGDGICVVAPIGVFFGRIANFINGELYGRVTDSALGMKFPQELHTNGQLSDALAEAAAVNEKAAALLHSSPEIGSWAVGPLMEIGRSDPKVNEILGEHVALRYPSQLFEAALEGLALFAILYWVRIRFPRLGNGVITGLFFLFYAVFRIVAEHFREPDASLMLSGTFLEMTKGQFYSTFMIILGTIFLVTGLLGWNGRTSDRNGG